VDRQLLSEAGLDARLNRSNPVDRAKLDTDSVRAALASMRINEPRGQGRVSPKRSSVFRARRLTALAFATAVVAVASLVGIETLTGNSSGGGLPLAVSPAAAAELHRVASAAAGQPAPSAGQWDYLAIRIENQSTATAGMTTVAYVLSSTVQEWNRSRGSIRQRNTADSFYFLTPQDRATYRADPTAFDQQINERAAIWNGGHARTFSGPVSDHVSPGASSQEPLWGTFAPKDPRALIRDIRKQIVVPAPNPAHAGLEAQFPALLFGTLSSLLVNTTNPHLRAIAYAALAYVPGTYVLGDQKDQLGRAGIAISFSLKGSHGTTGGRSKIIVSPRTGDLLEVDVLSTKPSQGFPVGTVVQREIFLQSGLVDSDTALPGGGTQPYKPLTFRPDKYRSTSTTDRR
jgi:hypothetical protein